MISEYIKKKYRTRTQQRLEANLRAAAKKASTSTPHAHVPTYHLSTSRTTTTDSLLKAVVAILLHIIVVITRW